MGAGHHATVMRPLTHNTGVEGFFPVWRAYVITSFGRMLQDCDIQRHASLPIHEAFSKCSRAAAMIPVVELI